VGNWIGRKGGTYEDAPAINEYEQAEIEETMERE
jgi:hypothetical protein